MATQLVSFPGLKNEAAKSDALPSRIKVFNWGKNPTLKGDFWLDDRSLNGQFKTADGKMLFGFNDVQKGMGWDTIALDYEHNTVEGTTAYKESADPRPVAAHLNCEIVRGDGLYCNVSDWTESGKSNAKNYADLSGAPLSTDINGQNVIMGMHSVALTQHGATEGLSFLTQGLSAGLKSKITTLSASFMEGSDNQTKGYQMNEYLKACRTFLGADDKMSDDEVMKCMSEHMEKGDLKMVREGPLNKAGGTSPTIKTFSAEDVNKLVAEQMEKLLSEKLTPLTASVTALTAAAQDATKSAEKSQRDSLVAQATKDHKIIPLSSEAIGRMPVSDLAELVKGLPVQNLQTRRSQVPLVKTNSNGNIQRGQVISLSVNGGAPAQVTLNSESSAPAVSGLKRTSELFAQQLQNSGLYCRQ